MEFAKMVFNDLLVRSKEIALVLFFVVFVGIVLWAFWPGNRDRFEKEGKKILEDEEQ